jgi:hypothetical protein
MQRIDAPSFQYLNYHYALDKSYVYYYDSILVGADAQTFAHIAKTPDARDRNYCYRLGEKVDWRDLGNDNTLEKE